MKIELDIDTMPDELYNMLLMTFVKTAVAQGVPVTGGSTFKNWIVSAEFRESEH